MLESTDPFASSRSWPGRDGVRQWSAVNRIDMNDTTRNCLLKCLVRRQLFESKVRIPGVRFKPGEECMLNTNSPTRLPRERDRSWSGIIVRGGRSFVKQSG